MLIRLLVVVLFAASGGDQFRLRVVAPVEEEEDGCAGATVTVEPTQAEVSAALGSASSGDTVCMEAGEETWTSGVTIPDGVTLKGAGTPDTSASTYEPSATCQQTVITPSSAKTIILFTMAATYGDDPPRLSCLELDYGAVTTVPAVGFEANGTCTSEGCPELIVDNVTFTNWFNIGAAAQSTRSNSWCVNALSGFFGVLHHNKLTGNAIATAPSEPFLQMVNIGLPAYLGVGAFGDNDWAQPENFGSAGFLFFENNTLENGAAFIENESTVVPIGGGRVVARNNVVNQVGTRNPMLNWHGLESNGRPRPPHAIEAYRNTFTCTTGSCGSFVGGRDGTGILWGNIIVNVGTNMNTLLSTSNPRAEADIGGWESCAGNVAYDTNDGGATPTVYFEGTVASGGGDATFTVEETGGGDPAWDNDEWIPAGAPYAVYNVTKGKGHVILDNTSNTLTIQNTGTAGAYFDADGDEIQILRPTVCMDQPGRGQSILFSNNPAEPAEPAANALVPIYVFMTTKTGNNFIFGTQGVSARPVLRIIRNRDFYHDNLNQTAQTSASAPFDGTTTIGIGYGIVSRRPTTCTTGVAYWATDEGEWDSTNGATADGKMYVCTATDTWTARYGGATSNTSGLPYTYPHQLVTP